MIRSSKYPFRMSLFELMEFRVAYPLLASDSVPTYDTRESLLDNGVGLDDGRGSIETANSALDALLEPVPRRVCTEFESIYNQ